MPEVSPYLHTKFFKFSVILLIIYSIVCTQIPLFNYLGFEYSALSVLVLGLISGLLTLSFLNKSSLTLAYDFWSFQKENLKVQTVIFTIPFLISIANAVFVKNCSVGNGVVLYLLIVIPGVLFSISVATFIGIALKKFRYMLFVVLYVVILLHIPLVTIIRPQVFAFNPIIGFFPGFTFDETLEVTKRLIVYRLATLAGTGLILVFTAWFLRRKNKKCNIENRSQVSLSIIEIALLSFLTPIVFIIFLSGNKLGLSSSEEYIKQKLIGYYRTENFDIYFSSGSIKKDKMEKIGLLHEFYYERIVK